MTLRVALTGAGGQLGTAFRKLAPATWEILCPSWREFSSAWFGQNQPSVIVNAAAYNAVELAEHEPAQAYHTNTKVPAQLAEWAAAHGTYMIHFSTDYVFSGSQTDPISEDTQPTPVNVYGASKAEGEKFFLQSGAMGCLIRTSAVFGARGKNTAPHNFIEKILARAAAGRTFTVRDDLTFRPTWADDLARVTVQKITDRAAGIFHCTSAGQTTWCEWAREILARFGKNSHLVEACRGDIPGQVRRPRYTVLRDSRHHPSTNWLTALDIYLRDREA